MKGPDRENAVPPCPGSCRGGCQKGMVLTMNKNKSASWTAAGRIPARETALFCTQAGLLLKAGIPLGEGLSTLTAEGSGAGRDRLQQIAGVAQETGSLYEAVRRAGVFPSYMVQMIRIGETAGKLEDVLDSLSLYYEREDRLRAAVRRAVLYPIVLILLMAAVIAVLVVAVMPVFSSVLTDLGAEAAADTGLMNLGVGIGRCALVVIGVLLLLLIGLLVLSLFAKGRSLLMSVSAHLPILRRLYRQIASGRFASVMSMLLSSGYNLGESLELAEEVVHDPVVKDKIRRCRDSVSHGTAFSAALLELDLFTGLYARLVQTGEKAGRLDDVMKKMAAQYETDVDESLSGLVSVIEPTLVMILSVIIGSILLSVMLPLIGILSAIG